VGWSITVNLNPRLRVSIDAIDQAVNALTGKPVQAEIKTGLNVITRETIADGSATKYVYKTDC